MQSQKNVLATVLAGILMETKLSDSEQQKIYERILEYGLSNEASQSRAFATVMVATDEQKDLV